MGLLTEGTALTWPETKGLADHVRSNGILQFINQYHKLKHRKGDDLKYGDEIEYIMVSLNRKLREAKLLLVADKVLPILRQDEEKNPEIAKTLWRPEYANYMVEGTPGKPYCCSCFAFNTIEANMTYRRMEVERVLENVLPKDEDIVYLPIMITNFPCLGCPNSISVPSLPTPSEGVSRSLYVPDDVIFPGHPRFATLTKNIRERRGEKVNIQVPVMFDERTDPLIGHPTCESYQEGQIPGHVHCDAMAFGMGMCCLQMTFQTTDVSEARHLYDQLVPLCPVMLALTAATPIMRGYLTERDCRWDVISESVDCRTRAERGLEPFSPSDSSSRLITTSRYSSVDCYLTSAGAKYNDQDVAIHEDSYKKLRDAGVDALLSQHIAHLFTRDSVSIFSERIHQNNEREMDHFENLNSTYWQSMRFKIPPPESSIGWRVEFRPCEVQLTDFENAAIVCFIVLFTRVILTYKLDLLMDISKVKENFERAQKRDAVLKEKFHFLRNFKYFSDDGASLNETVDGNEETREMTLDEIMNGKEDGFTGLIPLVHEYLQSCEDLDVDTTCTISQYLHLISMRASGKLQTPAAWIRDFVMSHKEYAKDSIVTQSINYDLLEEIYKISSGKSLPRKLLFEYVTKSKEDIPQLLKNYFAKGFSPSAE